VIPGNMVADISVESRFHSFFAAGFGVHNSAMAKQAIGPNSSRIELRFDTNVKTLVEPDVPIFATDAHETIGMDQYPSGAQVILAITTYTGQNQEDSIIVNKASIERGLFKRLVYFSYTTVLNPSSEHRQEIRIPQYSQENAHIYSKLDLTTAIVRVGVEVVPGDCLIGKVNVNLVTNEVTNDSLFVEIGKRGVVDEVYDTKNGEGHRMIRIRLRYYANAEVGDKLASRYSQKGTIGAILPEADMPYIIGGKHWSGVIPDIIFNPHGIPSRMTMGKLIELLVGHVAVIKGKRINATAFRRFNYISFMEELRKLGYSEAGKTKMYSGLVGNGLPMEATITFGPVYYQVLNHFVADKVQARGTGSVNFLTRLPVSGIRKQGGLRLGEMESAGLVETGASNLLRERMFVSADFYVTYVCKACGFFATLNNFHKEEANPFSCNFCQGNSVVRIEVPYSFKLLLNYLSAMNIKVKMRPVAKGTRV